MTLKSETLIKRLVTLLWDLCTKLIDEKAALEAEVKALHEALASKPAMTTVIPDIDPNIPKCEDCRYSRLDEHMTWCTSANLMEALDVGMFTPARQARAVLNGCRKYGRFFEAKDKPL